MPHPKADPAALAARWLGPLRDHPLLVVDPPDLAAVETLDPERRTSIRWFCTHWPTHTALLEAGYPSSFGPWCLPDLEFGAALLFLSRSRDRTRMTLSMLSSTLPTGAPLWVVGAKGDGIESAQPQVDEVTVSEGAQVGKHARLLMGRVRDHRPGSSGESGAGAPLDAFISEWTLPMAPIPVSGAPSNALAGTARPFTGSTSGTPAPSPLRIASLPGVFSHGRLDDGTRLLLETVPDLPGPLLDVGCGAGILGAWYAARGSGPVTLVDADALAVESARRTLALNGLEGEVVAGDVLPASPETTPFASIVSNPPFHQGSATDDRVTATLIAGAPARLARGGTLTLVCNRFLPIPDRLDRVFGSHRILADDGRYRVYRAVRG
jgi:16S rRNA G1207 methylase RsmC